MNKMWIKYARKYCAALLLLLTAGTVLQAQYYYKDIVTSGQIGANFRLLKSGGIAQVTVTPSGTNGPDGGKLNLEQSVFARQNRMVTHTQSPDAGESWLTSVYDEAGYLVATTDSSADVVTRVVYHYNPQHQVSSISSIAITRDHDTATEEHHWYWLPGGRPEKMTRTRDGRDTTFVQFVPDEKGNTGEEKVTRNKTNMGSTYYYYDEKNRLTDVAAYNSRAGRILPAYMFSYDNAGRITQMIIVPEGTSNYQTWKYEYNDQGLKLRETCYDKHKQMLGRVDYHYQ